MGSLPKPNILRTKSGKRDRFFFGSSAAETLVSYPLKTPDVSIPKGCPDNMDPPMGPDRTRTGEDGARIKVVVHVVDRILL